MDIDAQTARLLIVGGATVGLGGIAAIITLARGGRKPQKTRERLLAGDLTDDGGALKMMDDNGSLKPFGGDRVASPGVQGVYDDIVARSGERTTALAAPFGGSEIPPPRPAPNVVAAGLFNDCEWPSCGCEFDAVCDEVLALPEAELHAQYAGDVPTNYAPMHGRRHHVRNARVVGNQIEVALYDGATFVRLYTRRYNAIAAAYRLNAALGVD